jgi:mono/diheme cytochrome c family protein
MALQTVTKMACLKSNRWTFAAVGQSLCGVAATTAALLAVGCGKAPEAEFSLRESTTELIQPAEKAVKKALAENFGTPQSIEAWQRLPVNYGGVKGAIAEVSRDGATTTLDGDATQVVNGAPLLWLTGARANDKQRVESVAGFDPVTKKLSWSSSAEPAPAAGDTFVVGFGKSLQTGRVVYMRNCMHCHGVAGDGNGPTAKYLNPLPRDYRQGLFKFTSTLNPEKPTRDDLNRIVKYGIPGTYMPSFLWLGETESEAVVEYVRWLAMRGEFEKRLTEDLTADYSEKTMDETFNKAMAAFKAAKAKDKPERPKSLATMKAEARDLFVKYEKEDFPTVIDDTGTYLATTWSSAETPESLVTPSVPRVTDDAASRERGRKLFASDKGKCYTCHGLLGRGDGGATEDFWKKPGSDEFYPRRGLHDSWGQPLQPRNLTLGQYRGGRRPVDVFRRIYAGIKGTPMPAFGRTALKDEEIWDVVNYVMSLQYQSAEPSRAKPAEHVAVSK